MENIEIVISAGLIFIAIASFFLIFRAIVLWYWKINKITNLLEKIEQNTRKEVIETEDKKSTS